MRNSTASEISHQPSGGPLERNQLLQVSVGILLECTMIHHTTSCARRMLDLVHIHSRCVCPVKAAVPALLPDGDAEV